MKIAGRGLTELHTVEGAQWFKSMYQQTHWENIVDYETFRTTTLRADKFKYVVFVDPGGGVKRAIMLEEKDYLKFYAQEGGHGYSNTSGIGYVRAFVRNEQKYNYDEVAMFALEDSPYDVLPDDDEFDDIIHEHADELAADMNILFGHDHDSNIYNTLFISCS